MVILGTIEIIEEWNNIANTDSARTDPRMIY